MKVAGPVDGNNQQRNIRCSLPPTVNVGVIERCAGVNEDYKRQHDYIYSSALLFIAQQISGHLSGNSTVGKRAVGAKPMRAEKVYLCRIHMYTLNTTVLHHGLHQYFPRILGTSKDEIMGESNHRSVSSLEPREETMQRMSSHPNSISSEHMQRQATWIIYK
jgi:hypothetical protein